MNPADSLVSSLLVKLKQRAWVRHLIAAWERLRVTNGNQYAAAITYFSFLAIFPLILLAVSIGASLAPAYRAARVDPMRVLRDQ